MISSTPGLTGKIKLNLEISFFYSDQFAPSIRPFYVMEKTVATFGTFALLLTMTENFILPLVPTKEQSFFRSLLDLSLPFMLAYLLLFYIIFGKFD